jgi:hypothetical protein
MSPRRSPVVLKSETEEDYYFDQDHRIHKNEEIDPQSPTIRKKTIHKNMGLLATPVRISKMMSNRSESENDDRMGTAIFTDNPFTIDPEHQKEDELAFCNRMACILTRSTDFPMLCQTKFPSLVEAAVSTKNSTPVTVATSPAEIHHYHEEQHHDSIMMEGNYSSTNLYYIPPPSDR